MKILKILTLSLITLTPSMQTYSQDWPDLNRYKNDNIEILNDSTRTHDVVFMGNSITEGWINMSPDFFESNDYINRGISGQTTPQMLLRFRSDVIDLGPSYVVILAGINDIAENTGPSTIKSITDNIRSMIELSSTNHIKVLICSVLPANRFTWRPDIKPADKVIELNNILKSFADNTNVYFVDYYSKMVDAEKGLMKELGSDGVHPNLKGYTIMESILSETFKAVKNKRN